MMKTKKSFIGVVLISLFIAGVSMKSFASSEAGQPDNVAYSNNNVSDHAALASEYESLAKEMQAKIEEQKEILEHKPRTSRFGKHGKDVKSHIAYKIHMFEQAEQEYLEKAAYHRAIAAGRLPLQSAVQPTQTDFYNLSQ